MKLDEIENGSVYIDTNVLYMYLRVDPAYRDTILSFMKRIVARQIKGIVSVLAVDELFYRLLLALVKENSPQNPLKVLRGNPAEVISQHSSAVRATLEMLLSLPGIELVGVERDATLSMMENIERYGLLPRDALHVAVMERLGVSIIASDDTDFDRVPLISRAWLFNPPGER